MKKNSSQQFNEKYDNIELRKGDSFLGKKIERKNIQNENGNCFSLKIDKKQIMNEINNYTKHNEKNDSNEKEKRFKIILSKVEDGDDDDLKVEDENKLINLKKKRSELKILNRKY